MWCFGHVCTCPSVSCVQSCRKLKSAAWTVIFFNRRFMKEGAMMCSVVVAIFTMFWHDSICERSFCLCWEMIKSRYRGKKIEIGHFQNWSPCSLCQNCKRLFQNVQTRKVGAHQKFGRTACVGSTILHKGRGIIPWLMCSYVIVACHRFLLYPWLVHADDSLLSIIVLNGFDTGILRNHALSVFQQQAILLNQRVTVPGQLGKSIHVVHALGRGS